MNNAISTALTPYLTSATASTTYLTQSSASSTYLALTGGTMTGALNLTLAYNPIYINSTNTGANNCIHIQNSTYNAYIGLGGTAFGGNYANNLFLEASSSAIAFNTGGNTSTSTPTMIILANGNIGIGTTNPQYKLDSGLPDNTATTTNVLEFKNSSGYGIYATSTSISNRGNTLDILANDYNSGTITTRSVLSLRPEGNVGIGTTTPNAPLHIYSTTQAQSRLILSGQEFYQSVAQGGGMSSDGIAFLLGVNRTGNRQLWIGDTANLGIGTTNSVIRIMPTGTPTIDYVATDGQTRLNMNIGNAMTFLANNTVSIRTNLIMNSGGSTAISFGGNYPAPALDYARNAGDYSTSSTAGDLILRSDTNKNLILQSGFGNSGIYINSVNNVAINNNLSVGSGVNIDNNSSLPFDNQLNDFSMESIGNLESILNFNLKQIKMKKSQHDVNMCEWAACRAQLVAV